MGLRLKTMRRGLSRALAGIGGLAVIAALFASPGPARATALERPAANPVVVTHDGAVRGFDVEEMRAFLGLPYARPPIGALRWRPPQPPAAWHGVRDGTKYAPHCAQNGAGAFGTSSVDENCLYLNVYTPPNVGRGHLLPVMFWIHGGGFTNGESDTYDPNRIVRDGVIVVTINYRLGLLGFYAQSGLDAEWHAHMNYGLMDQQQALLWVQRNIAAFGGDPETVTIFGESAGGLSVLSQLASPGAHGLFARAIAESGAYQTTLPTLAAAEVTGNNLASAWGCSNQQASCLRAIPVKNILAATPSQNVPAIDGVVLPASPQAAFTSGHFNRVPVMNGSNHDEFRLFTAEQFDLSSNGPLTAQEYPGILDFVFGSLGPKVLARYPLSAYPSPDLAFSALMTDWVFSCQTRNANDALARRVPTFAYEFADEKAPEVLLPPVSFPYGSAHASELQFLWDLFTHPQPIQLSKSEHDLAKQMVSYWTQFAKYGNPNGAGTTLWPAYIGSADNLESLVAPDPKVKVNFANDHECPEWRSYPPPDIACILAGICQLPHSLPEMR
jgi:para-nitrobenzyl esterase